METLKTSIFSFIIINVVNKGILHFLINDYLWIALRKNLFIDSLVEKIMKVLNASIFSFIILNLVKKSILDFYVTTATAICLKEVIYSCLRRALERKIMETLKALILTIIVLNLVSKGLFLLYCHITDPSISYRTLWYRQPVVL